jgi:transposase
MNGLDPLPSDLAAAHAMLRAERAARHIAETQLAERNAVIARQVGVVAALRLEIERLKLLLAKARREQYGQSSERGAKLVEQLELQLTELEETVAEEEAAAELAAPSAQPEARARTGRKPARRPLPAHLPRERIVYPAPCACPKCGGPVRKLGEDVTETLDHAR